MLWSRAPSVSCLCSPPLYVYLSTRFSLLSEVIQRINECSDGHLQRYVGKVLTHRRVHVFLGHRRGALLIHPFLDVDTVVLSVSDDEKWLI